MNRLLLLILACCCSIGLAAQQITIDDVNKKMSQGKQSGLLVFIPGVNDNDAEKEWKKLIKDWDGKPEKKRGEVFADDVFLSSISTNTIDLYAELKDKNDGTEMIVWFDLGGAYLSKSDHQEQWDRASSILRDFAYDLALAALEDVLKGEEKTLGNLEGDLGRLGRDRDNLLKSIEKWEDSIAKARQDLEKNQGDQDEMIKEIERQTKAVEAARKNLEKLEK